MSGTSDTSIDSPVSLRQAVQLFDQFADRRDLSHGFALNYCYDRAEIIAFELAEAGYSPKIITDHGIVRRFRDYEVDDEASQSVEEEPAENPEQIVLVSFHEHAAYFKADKENRALLDILALSFEEEVPLEFEFSPDLHLISAKQQL